MGNLSTTVRLESDATLVLIANGHSKIDHQDEWLYLSFFVEGQLVPGPPATPQGDAEMGHHLNHYTGEWMAANFTQIHVVRDLQYPKDVQIDLKIRTNGAVQSTCLVNGAAIQILTMPAGRRQ